MSFVATQPLFYSQPASPMPSQEAATEEAFVASQTSTVSATNHTALFAINNAAAGLQHGIAFYGAANFDDAAENAVTAKKPNEGSITNPS